jgi:hypothetical protein
MIDKILSALSYYHEANPGKVVFITNAEGNKVAYDADALKIADILELPLGSYGPLVTLEVASADYFDKVEVLYRHHIECMAVSSIGTNGKFVVPDVEELINHQEN